MATKKMKPYKAPAKKNDNDADDKKMKKPSKKKY